MNNKIGKPLEIIEENVSDNYFRANTYNVKVNIPSDSYEFKKIVISF